MLVQLYNSYNYTWTARLLASYVIVVSVCGRILYYSYKLLSLHAVSCQNHKNNSSYIHVYVLGSKYCFEVVGLHGGPLISEGVQILQQYTLKYLDREQFWGVHFFVTRTIRKPSTASGME